MVMSTKVILTLAITFSIISVVQGVGERGRLSRQRREYNQDNPDQNPDNYVFPLLTLSVNQTYDPPQPQYVHNAPQYQYGNIPNPHEETFEPSASHQSYQAPTTFDFFQPQEQNENEKYYSASAFGEHPPVTRNFLQSHHHSENPDLVSEYSDHQESSEWNQQTTRDFFQSEQHNESGEQNIPTMDFVPQQGSERNQQQARAYYNFLDLRQSPGYSAHSQFKGNVAGAQEEVDFHHSEASGREAANPYGEGASEPVFSYGAGVHYDVRDSRTVFPYEEGASGSGAAYPYGDGASEPVFSYGAGVHYDVRDSRTVFPYVEGASGSGAAYPYGDGASGSGAAYPYGAGASASRAGYPYGAGASGSGAAYPYGAGALGSGAAYPYEAGTSGSGAGYRYGGGSGADYPYGAGGSGSGAGFEQGGASGSRPDPENYGPLVLEPTQESDPNLMSQGEINAYNANNEIVAFIPKENRCYLNINKLPSNHGIFINAQRAEIVYPKRHDYLRLRKGEKIYFLCPGNSEFNISNTVLDIPKEPYLALTCNGSALINDLLRRELTTEEYACRNEVLPSMRYSKRNVLCQNLDSFKLGILVHKTYSTVKDFCCKMINGEWQVEFVITELNTHLEGQEVFGNLPENFYAGFKVTTRADEPGLIGEANSFATDVTREYYETDRIKRHLLTLLGEFAYDRLTQGDEQTYHITPGFLSGRYEHVYRLEQKTAFHYANIKPMWSNLKRNWDRVDIAISMYTHEGRKEKKNLLVYAGTYGVMSHQNSEGKSIELYLGERNGIPYLYIPKYFWKYVTDYEGNCVVIFGFNSPYDMTENDIVCRNKGHTVTPVMPDEIPWLTTKLKAQKTDGSVFACRCQDAKYIRYIPINESDKRKNIPLLV